MYKGTCLRCGRVLDDFKWIADRWGHRKQVAQPDQVIRRRAFFADTMVTVSLIDCRGNDTCAWNHHFTIGNDGEIYRIDLCLAYKDKLEEAHPHVFVDNIINGVEF
jgi:hypothetical protein